MPLSEDLYEHLKSSSAPLLFVGSGLTRRYAETEDWEGLLRMFSHKAGVDYAQQNARANRYKPQVASAIAEAFFDVWWDDPEYKESVEKYPAPNNRESPFKIEVANYFRTAERKLPREGISAEEIEDLREASVRGIAAVVTTNFDTITDSLFPGFSVYRSQEELLMSTPYGGRELFKIHGCRTDPESMVLTKDDYHEFNRRSPYLSAKLLTLFAEHPVVFLGYSIDDPHIRQILLDVSQALSAASLAKLEGQLIFVRRTKDGGESRLVSSSFMIDNTPIPMIYADVADQEYGEVFKALKRIRPKLPTKVVAQLKSEVYKIIESERPTSEIYTRDIESLDGEKDVDQIEVVVGVGIRDQLGALGFTGVSREHLFDDVIDSNPKFRGPKAALEILGIIGKISKTTYVPVFKYLFEAGFLDEAGKLLEDGEPGKRVRKRAAEYRARLVPYEASGARPKQLAEKYKTVSGLLENCTDDEVLEALLCLKERDVNSDELRLFLSEKLSENPNSIPTPLARAICFFDYVTYGPGAQ